MFTRSLFVHECFVSYLRLGYMFVVVVAAVVVCLFVCLFVFLSFVVVMSVCLRVFCVCGRGESGGGDRFCRCYSERV